MNFEKSIISPGIAPVVPVDPEGEMADIGIHIYIPAMVESVPPISEVILAMPQWISLIHSQEKPSFPSLRFSHDFVRWSSSQLTQGREVFQEATVLSTALSPPRPIPIPAVREGLPLSPLDLATHISRANPVVKGMSAVASSKTAEVPTRSQDPRMHPPVAKEPAVTPLVSAPSTSSKYRIEATGDQEGRQQQDRGGSDQDPPRKDKKKGIIVTQLTNKKMSHSLPPITSPPAPPVGIQEIFIRFMSLMAKILGQAEAEAHELYQKVKHRTDQIDTLTQLIQKINSENKGMDWTNQPQLLGLIDRAREIGVDIPLGKKQWTEEEKRLLKENIQLRKDSLEKITQLERTDMQRYLQEASQCHQARSNILKLHKEVMDTIIHNLRP